jgi:hypothetical protein
MPEASVNEDCLLAAWQNDVRLSGQILPVQAKSISHGMQKMPNDHLRSGVLALDGLHDAPSLFWAASVHAVIYRSVVAS